MSKTDYNYFHAGSMPSLAARAGIDTTLCEFCNEPLDDTRPWRRGLDGCGAHEACIERFL